MVTGGITFFPCRSLDAVQEFLDLLGVPLALDQGACRIYRLVPGSYVGFCEHLAPVENAASLMITLLVEDVGGWFDRAMAAGLDVDGSPRVNERFAIEHFFIAMPDGYRVEVQRFLDPAWDQA